MNTQLAELAKNFDVSLRGALSALATLLICLLAVRIVTKAARRLLSRSPPVPLPLGTILRSLASPALWRKSA